MQSSAKYFFQGVWSPAATESTSSCVRRTNSCCVIPFFARHEIKDSDAKLHKTKAINILCTVPSQRLSQSAGIEAVSRASTPRTCPLDGPARRSGSFPARLVAFIRPLERSPVPHGAGRSTPFASRAKPRAAWRWAEPRGERSLFRPSPLHFTAQPSNPPCLLVLISVYTIMCSRGTPRKRSGTSASTVSHSQRRPRCSPTPRPWTGTTPSIPPPSRAPSGWENQRPAAYFCSSTLFGG